MFSFATTKKKSSTFAEPINQRVNQLCNCIYTL